MNKTLLTVIIAVTLAVPGLAQQRVDETRAVAPDAAITVESISGTISVIGWERPEMHVVGTLGRGIEKLDISGSSSRLDLRVVYPRDCRHCESAELEIKVPVGCRLEVKTVSADVDASRLTGDVRLNTVSGEIKVAAGGSVRAKSVSGRLTILEAGRELDATTVSGALNATLAVLGNGEFESVSGDIRIEADLAPKARVEVKTVSGSIELRVPASVGADFDIESFSGSIRNDFGAEARRTSEYGPGRELRFTQGTGSARVLLKTLSGSVRVLRR